MIAWALTNWRVLMLATLLLIIGALSLEISHQRALLAESKLEKAELITGYAQAAQNATTEAMQRFESETQRANGIAAQLIETRKALSSARANITGRIEHAAASVPADCAFGPEFVGLWNDAHGLRAGALPEGAAPGGTAGQPGQTRAAGAGIRGNASVADLLAHGRDYGAYCQAVEAQRDGLMQFVTEGK